MRYLIAHVVGGNRFATLVLDGGTLDIEWRADDHILMTGPVELEHTGELELG